MSSIFGWLVNGPLPPTHQVTALKVDLKEDETYELCQKFWELEQVPEVTRHTSEEESALEQFDSHRESDGRYSVKLPRVNPPPLGNSKRKATSRFQLHLGTSFYRQRSLAARHNHVSK